MQIFRGTTPTIIFTFTSINPSDIETAYLVLKQGGEIVLEKGIDSAEKTESTISWLLSQEDTLLLTRDKPAEVYCDWRLISGLRGVSEAAQAKISDSGKDEVI